MWRQALALITTALLVAAISIGAATTVGANTSSQPTDSEAVLQTMYSYGYQLDSGTIDGLMALFTDDATAHYVLNGTVLNLQGKPAIRDFLAPNTDVGGNHNLLNPLIHVSGDTATGTFYLWRIQPAPTTCPTNGSIGWLTGRYDNNFVNQHGHWLIKHLNLVLNASGTLDGCNAIV